MGVLLTPMPSATLALLHGAGEFSWSRWEVHPSVLVGCAAFALLYLAGVGPLRVRHRLAARVPEGKAVTFLAGVVLLFLALNGPLHELSDNFLLSAHMVQHMALMMGFPLLVLLGTPAWLIRPLLRPRPVYRIARFATHPVVAFTLYNAIFVGWHFPRMYDWALVNHDIHIVQHLMFIAAATLMWWPVVDPVPELSHMGSPLVMLYLFAFGVPMSVVSAFITMAEAPLYEFYAAAPRVFDISALEDQQLGGVIMWVPGMLIYWGAVAAVFLRWAAREERENRKEREILALPGNTPAGVARAR